MKRFKNLSLLLCASMLVATLGACSPKEAPAPSAGATETAKPAENTTGAAATPTTTNAGGKIVVAMGEEGFGLDPAIGTDAVSQTLVQALYEGFFSLDEEGTLIKRLCESYTNNEDHTVFTFKIVDGAKWSDGKAITASDFVYSVKKQLDPNLKSLYSSQLYDIVGAEAYYKDNTISFESTVGVKALDDKTVEYTLTKSVPYFPKLLAFSIFYPIRSDVAPTGTSKWALDPTTAISNGPFKLAEYKANDKVVAVKNENYREVDRISLDTIEFRFMADEQAQVAAFKTGEVQIATRPTADISATFKDSPDLYTMPLVANYYVTIRAKDVLEDVRVRRALAYAVNREDICTILNNGSKPLYGFVPFGMKNDETGKDFREEGGNLLEENVDEAKKLLAEAGFPDGNGFPTITYIYNPTQTHGDVAQTLQHQWKTNLGINIELKSLEWNVFLTERGEGNFELSRHAMSADYQDPTTFLSMYLPNGTQNDNKYNSAAYEAKYNEANASPDLAKRMELLHDAEKIIVQDDVMVIPLFGLVQPTLVSSKLTGISSDPSGTLLFSDIKIN